MSENTYILVLLVLTIAVLVADGFYFTWLYFRIRAKGYRSPLVTLAVGLPPFIGFFGGLILYLTSDRLINANAATFDPRLVEGSLVSFAIYVGGAAVAVACVVGAIAACLPKRPARSFGVRRVAFPWRRAGQFLIGLAALLICLEWVFGIEKIQSLRLAAQILLPALLYCFYMARRESAADLNAAIAADSRAPVLYLRAFNRETDVFADVSLRDLQSYTSYLLNRSAVTFEQYFGKAINDGIGPFVALGSPEDYLPPEGAARTYADDSGWMNQFTALSARAACILMEVDESSNLQWELASLRSAALQQKLYVFTRPREMRGWRNARIMLGRQVYRLLARVKGLRPISWSAFVVATRPLGYSFPETDPGPGAVIGVDASGKGVVLTRDAVAPRDYLAAVVACLSTNAFSLRPSER